MKVPKQCVHRRRPIARAATNGIATPLWDFAWVAYRFVPLYDEATCERLGYPLGRQAERLRILSDAFGLEDRGALLPSVCERIRVLYETARVYGGDRVARVGGTYGETPAARSGLLVCAT